MDAVGYKLYSGNIDTADAVLPRLHLACYRGDVAAVKRHVQAGDDIDQAVDLSNANKQIVVGVTPLYLAAQQGHVAVCELLVQAGADPMRRCGIPSTGEVFGAAEIALIHFHFRTWWFLNRNKSPGGPGRHSGKVPAQLAEPLLS